jgi:hypothetical protein
LSWIPNKAPFGRRFALAALLSATAVSASANVLVVRSAGPSARTYPAGRSLTDDARIQLRAGDTLVVLDARGTRTFRGPGNFTAAGAATQGMRIAETNGRRARIGAVRSAGFVASSPTTIWHVDVSQSGNMCLANTSNVMLWRPEASLATTLTIAGPGGTRNVAWPAGRTTVAWPADLPIANGGAYSLSQSGTAVPSRVTFRTLNSAPGDMQAVADALIRNGCQEQLDLLVDSAPAG